MSKLKDKIENGELKICPIMSFRHNDIFAFLALDDEAGIKPCVREYCQVWDGVDCGLKAKACQEP